MKAFLLFSVFFLGALALPCMEDRAGLGHLVCTSEDIKVAEVVSLTVAPGDGCDSLTDTVSFTATFRVQRTATSTRYDIGLNFARDGDPNGDGALKGDCDVWTPPKNLSPFDWDDDADNCGDIVGDPAIREVVLTFSNIPCADADHNGLLDLPYCSSWRVPGTNTVCNTAADTTPSAKSKCFCDIHFFVPIIIGGGIVVNLVTLDPSGTSFASTEQFGFTTTSPAGGTTPLPASFALDTSPNTDATRTFSSLRPGNGYFFSSTAPDSTWTRISTVCTTTQSSLDGTVNSLGGTANINLRSSETVDCTFTYQKNPTPTILVDKTVTPTSFLEPGSAVTYTVAISSNVALPVTSWSDNQCGLSSAVSPPGSFPAFDCSTNTLRCVATSALSCSATGVGSINPYGGFTIPLNNVVTCTFNAFVCGDAGETLTNIFSATGQQSGFPAVTDDDDAVVTLTNQAPVVSASADWQYTACTTAGKTLDATIQLTVTLTVTTLNSADRLSVQGFTMTQGSTVQSCTSSQVASTISATGTYTCAFSFSNNSGNISASLSLQETTDTPAFTFSFSRTLMVTGATAAFA